ncbi:DUF2326 domain-containing protein [Agrobacterium vitis]|uniref:DUF2326 domain-containing protein n=1 Tax=Agrobacterium vitis TaxID=373 RepID=UPI0012E77C62|nr:DUF2326 domain-containing protein [Agrobacterium vitis]MVA52592.1 DUF2326 domain-containing protein [Agrobacterium vitis]
MQLSRLYTNFDNLFTPIDFNCETDAEVLNVVYGDVSRAKDGGPRDSHNLGKTTLIHLIDFMFLKDITGSRHFLETHAERFSKFQFYLEIGLNDGTFLTVKREVVDNNKIALKKHEDRGQNFASLASKDWDHDGVSRTAARELLDGILDLRIISPYDYRKALSYFLRTQEDYNDVLQLQKFVAGAHLGWKPFVMTLLGFNEEPVERKYRLDQDIEEKENDKKKKEAELQVDETDLLRLSAEIRNKKVELEETEADLDRFEFSSEERRLMHELVDVIEARIAETNDALYNVRVDIRNIDTSLKNKMSFNLSEVETIFKESELNFPGQLKKSYEALVEFNRQITNERNRTLRARKKELEEEQERLRAQRKVDDLKRQDYNNILQGTDTLEKFKRLQRNLAEQRADIAYLEGQEQRLSAIASLESEINKLKRDRSQVVDEIKALISKGTPARDRIAANFNLYCRRVLDHEGLFYVRQNGMGNVEFPIELLEKGSKRASRQSEGKSYKQMLCALFDLSVLKAYEDLPFYHFVYHDGILEGLDNRVKVRFLELVRELIGDGKIQYIMSIINSDLPRDDDDKPIAFSSEEVILRLDDSGDQGRLFKMPEF